MMYYHQKDLSYKFKIIFWYTVTVFDLYEI